MVRPAQKSPFAPRVMSPVLFAGVAPADGAASGGVVVVVAGAGAGGDDVVGGAPDAGDAAPSTPDEEHPATSTCASSATTSSRRHDLRATTSPSPRPPDRTGPDRNVEQDDRSDRGVEGLCDVRRGHRPQGADG